MNRNAAFISHIQMAPEDETLRLIYADWLDQNGQSALAEFIRLDSLSQQENGSRTGMEAVAKAVELIKIHRREWLAPLLALGLRERLDPCEVKDFKQCRAAFDAGHFLGCEFHLIRGLVTRIDVWGKDAAHTLITVATELFQLAPLQGLTFRPAINDRCGTVRPIDLIEAEFLARFLETPELASLDWLCLYGPGPGQQHAARLVAAASRLPRLRVSFQNFASVTESIQGQLRDYFGERVGFGGCGDDYDDEE